MGTCKSSNTRLPCSIRNHSFFKKLHIEEHEVTKEESGAQFDLEEEYEYFERYFSTLGIVGQKAIDKNVRDLTYQCTTSMYPPLVKYKQKKGAKKSKKGKESDPS